MKDCGPLQTEETVWRLSFTSDIQKVIYHLHDVLKSSSKVHTQSRGVDISQNKGPKVFLVKLVIPESFLNYLSLCFSENKIHC